MKRRGLTVYTVLAFVLTCLVGSGCNGLKQNKEAPVQYSIFKEEAPLVKEEPSPVLSLAMHHSWLNERTDSMASHVNRLIQKEIWGEEYADLSPETAADSFKNNRIRQYRQEVLPLYQQDLEENSLTTGTFPWYNHTYELSVNLQYGLEGILLCTVDTNEDRGGAHPDSWSRWMNIEKATGRLLKREDVFRADIRPELEQHLLKTLIHQQAGQNPDHEIHTLEDLQELGFLQTTSIYIPENFLLEPHQVKFLFNRYDIAPYSAGKIVLEVPYEEIGQWMNTLK